MNVTSEHKNVLIGSRALSHWDNSFKLKEEADWDIISEHPIEGAEHHRPDLLNNRAFAEKYCSDDFVDFNGHKVYVMLPKGLAIIKRSHLWRDLSFQKHITHYDLFLKKYMSDMTHEDNFFLKERTDLTMEIFPQRTPKLNVTKDEFFYDYVPKFYEHDWLHELVAFEKEPIYKLLQNSDKDSVWCSESKWNKLSYEMKCKCVAEEAYVISLERFVIPKNWDCAYKLSYSKALDKICTTLCSGYFRDFALDNYGEIFKLFCRDKYKMIQYAIKKTPESEIRYDNGAVK